MTRVLIVLGIAAVVFWVFSLVDVAVQPPSRHRGVSKGAWIAIVALIPVLGGVLWFVLGRARPQAGRVIAPDDDPAFLGTLKGVSDQDERIRLLEEELARLDSEDDPTPEQKRGEQKPHGDKPSPDQDGPAPDGAR